MGGPQQDPDRRDVVPVQRRDAVLSVPYPTGGGAVDGDFPRDPETCGAFTEADLAFINAAAKGKVAKGRRDFFGLTGHPNHRESVIGAALVAAAANDNIQIVGLLAPDACAEDRSRAFIVACAGNKYDAVGYFLDGYGPRNILTDAVLAWGRYRVPRGCSTEQPLIEYMQRYPEVGRVYSSQTTFIDCARRGDEHGVIELLTQIAGEAPFVVTEAAREVIRAADQHPDMLTLLLREVPPLNRVELAHIAGAEGRPRMFSALTEYCAQTAQRVRPILPPRGLTQGTTRSLIEQEARDGRPVECSGVLLAFIRELSGIEAVSLMSGDRFITAHRPALAALVERVQGVTDRTAVAVAQIFKSVFERNADILPNTKGGEVPAAPLVAGAAVNALICCADDGWAAGVTALAQFLRDWDRACKRGQISLAYALAEAQRVKHHALIRLLVAESDITPR